MKPETVRKELKTILAELGCDDEKAETLVEKIIVLFNPQKQEKQEKKEYPKNAFLLFCDDERENIRSECPSITFSEMAKELASRWKTLDEEEKKIFSELAEKEKERMGIVSKPKGEPRPKGPFLLFSDEMRKTLKQENSKLTSREVMMEIGRRWTLQKKQV